MPRACLRSRLPIKLVCHAGKNSIRRQRRCAGPAASAATAHAGGLTLGDVANRPSIDVSTLSRLESGKRRLALDHLPRLATALSVSTDELLRAPEAEDPRVRGGSHTHNDVTYWPLTRHGPAGGLRAYKIRVNPRRRTPPAELPVHEGQAWIYVLSGRMRLILGE